MRQAPEVSSTAADATAMLPADGATKLPQAAPCAPRVLLTAVGAASALPCACRGATEPRLRWEARRPIAFLLDALRRQKRWMLRAAATRADCPGEAARAQLPPTAVARVGANVGAGAAADTEQAAAEMGDSGGASGCGRTAVIDAAVAAEQAATDEGEGGARPPPATAAETGSDVTLAPAVAVWAPSVGASRRAEGRRERSGAVATGRSRSTETCLVEPCGEYVTEAGVGTTPPSWGECCKRSW